MIIKVGMVSLGCPKNQIDAEHLLSDISNNKHFKIVNNPDIADVVVINTCAFIESAKQEAIDTILEFAEKKEKNLKSIIVTGCLAQRYKNEILEQIPEVDVVLGLGSNKNLEEAIIDSLQGKKIAQFGISESLCLDHDRILTTPSHYAYLKIAEGCDNHCTYCAIPKIRGKYRSRTIENILKEAKWLEQKGVKELILVAQDTTYYGIDIYGKYALSDLFKEIAKLNFKWIRFLYAYPEKIDEKLLTVIKENDNILPYLDLPIQHINNDILKKMNRKTTREQILDKIKLIKTILPNSILRTTLIVGFPGETENQFNELVEFVKTSNFNRIGCFPYSQEEETAAALLPNQIPNEIKEKRVQTIMMETEILLDKYCQSMMNKNIEVIIDYFEDNYYIGRSIADAPDIDCCVYISSNCELNSGDMIKVKIYKTEYGNLFGEYTE